MGKPSNHSQLIDHLKDMGVRCRGVTINAQYDSAVLSGEWRNDTNKWVVITGMFIDYDSNVGGNNPASISLRAGDRQVTGGLVSLSTLVSIGHTSLTLNAQPPVEWPGYGVPVAPGESFTMAVSDVGGGTNNTFTYTAVIVEQAEWRPMKTFLESRFHVLTPKASAGSNVYPVQIPYACIVWDWFRANDVEANYKSTSVVRLHIDSTPITLNSISALGIPTNVYKPSSAIMLVKGPEFSINYYVDSNSASLSPAIAVRVAKFWGNS